MRPEDILLKAEKHGVRTKVFTEVAKLRKQNPLIVTEVAYDIAWDKVRKEHNIK